MGNKKLIGGILVLVIILIVVWLTLDETSYENIATYDEDTTIQEDVIIERGERITLTGGATLTIEGDLTVHGAIECADGPLSLVVTGATLIDDRLACQRNDTTSDEDLGLGISLVAQGGLVVDDTAEVESNGHIQFVGAVEHLATTQEELDALYDEVDTVPADGISVGPFLNEDEFVQTSLQTPTHDNEKFSFHSLLFPQAHAQAAPPVIISGKVRVGTPARGVRQIVLYYFPNASGITIQNFELSGPDGRKGTDDVGSGCTAEGSDGENAFKFNAFAPNLTVNNFTLNLGNGGDGGDAETTQDCKPGTATGGDGGNSGNFRMTAGNQFQINGAFVVHPGDGGAGGNATAHGKNGGASEDGGDATATAGKGADNKKKLSVQGSVAGTSNVQIGDVVGGAGGWASANPGTGGDGLACGNKGGDGGTGTATGGKGGDASLTLAGGAGRAPLAQNIGGMGGGADAFGAKAGNGGNCDPTGPGGNGGDGGDANTTEGKGGSGDSGQAADGVVLDETGGDGGNGGDGCNEGVGGAGGNGDPQGKDGEDGTNLCQLPPSPHTQVDIRDEEETATIQVIQWMNYYIPIDQLSIVPGHEPFCGEDHWHAESPVTTVQGGITSDPNPDGCGFCTISQCPVMEIPDPARN